MSNINALKTITSDVLVIGGGSAGCFAAISSARSGAKTLLIEKNGMLGGTATVGRVNFPGLFYAWGKQIIGGPSWEAILRCVKYKGAKLPTFPYKSPNHWDQQITLDVFTYTCVLDELCEEAGVNVLFHCMPYRAEDENGTVTVYASVKGGMLRIKAKAVIDATGDADVVRMMGYKCLFSEVTQPATLINTISGYRLEDIDRQAFSRYIDECYRSGKLSLEDSQGENMWKCLTEHRINMHVGASNAQTPEGKTEVEQRARKILFRIVRCLSEFPGLEEIYVSDFAGECGIRETARIVGEKSLTAEEYLCGKIFDDSVCYAFYPIDLHQSTGIKQSFLADGVVPSVRYGCLIPKGADKALVAGRCISSDAEANSALRVQATCMATGQVAGVAAALSAAENCSVADVPLEKLKEGLHSIGAIVPGDVAFT